MPGAAISGLFFAIHRYAKKYTEVVMPDNTAFSNHTRDEKAFHCQHRKQHTIHQVEQIVSESDVMKQLMKALRKIAPTQTAVILRGEPGTGKEVIARAIHHFSQVADGPFVKLCCEHLNDEKLMNDLFGNHEQQGKTEGKLHIADGGTLFLTEIAHFSLQLQGKLLQYLEENAFEPIGAAQPEYSNIRIICASEKDLEALVLTQHFLPELYYRLHIGVLNLPPLRERKADIPGLVRYFFERYNQINHRKLTIDAAVLKPIFNCHWPDNVRDLENCLEHAALLSEDDTVQSLPCQQGMCIRQYLDEKISQANKIATAQSEKKIIVGPELTAPVAGDESALNTNSHSLLSSVELERSRLVMTLEKCGWVKAKAARQLGITTRQLSYALQKLNIAVKKY
jgi:Transcriptional regulator containing GAF, AAA-type ATPase, and DNA binding domains